MKTTDSSVLPVRSFKTIDLKMHNEVKKKHIDN